MTSKSSLITWKLIRLYKSAPANAKRVVLQRTNQPWMRKIRKLMWPADSLYRKQNGFSYLGTCLASSPWSPWIYLECSSLSRLLVRQWQPCVSTIVSKATLFPLAIHPRSQNLVRVLSALQISTFLLCSQPRWDKLDVLNCDRKQPFLQLMPENIASFSQQNYRWKQVMTHKKFPKETQSSSISAMSKAKVTGNFLSVTFPKEKTSGNVPNDKSAKRFKHWRRRHVNGQRVSGITVNRQSITRQRTCNTWHNEPGQRHLFPRDTDASTRLWSDSSIAVGCSMQLCSRIPQELSVFSKQPENKQLLAVSSFFSFSKWNISFRLHSKCIEANLQLWEDEPLEPCLSSEWIRWWIPLLLASVLRGI